MIGLGSETLASGTIGTGLQGGALGTSPPIPGAEVAGQIPGQTGDVPLPTGLAGVPIVRAPVAPPTEDQGAGVTIAFVSPPGETAPGAQGADAPDLPTENAANMAAGDPSQPRWVRNATSFAVEPGVPLLAIIVDNAASGGIPADALANIGVPVTFGVIPDGSGASLAFADAAIAARHEVLIQIPMEPKGPADPGPEAIYVRMTDAEIAAQTRRLATRLEAAVGAMNQMGSRATEDRRVMDAVMAEIARAGLAFVDSRTTLRTVAGPAAEAAEVPYLRNTRFVAAESTPQLVIDAIERAARDAQRDGVAIVIGPPSEAMLQGILRWSIEQNGRVARLAPVSAVIRRIEGISAADQR